MADETNKTEEIKTEEQNKGTEDKTKKENNNNNNVNVEQVKKDALSEYLRELGVEDDKTLKEILTKHKEDEDAKKTDLEKKDETITETTRELAKEREARIMADAQLAAIKLGAIPELVEQLAIVAKSKVTKDKDINTVIAEMKDSDTGKIYFKDETEDKKDKGTVTRKKVQTKTKDEEEDEKTHKGSMAERLLANRKKSKNYYYK